jgi:UDP-GlcNAc:undecaprenyl-phosphate/decaprenyl-phosphate GlcNAc-1-phosphate transferase
VLSELVVVGVAFATVAVATPGARRLALRIGAVDQPDERRVHTKPTPRLGGLALFLGVLAGLAVGSQLPGFSRVFEETSEPQAIVLACLVIVGVGLLDDIRGISATAKLAGQVVAAGVLALSGVNLTFVYVPPGNVVALGPDLAALVTILAVVAMVNAVNLVDGLDGLAPGIVAIAAGALFAYVQLSVAVTDGLPSSAGLVLAAVVGACLAFLLYNFNPASIFMGDTGAMLLGLLLAAAGVSAVGGTIQPSRGAFAAFSIPVLVPAIVLAVPFADTVWAILRRLRSGRAVFSPDKQHLHHRLVEIGHSQRRAVLIMYYWSALLAFAGVGVSLLPLPVVVGVLTAGVVLALAAMVVGRLLRARHRRAGRARRFVSSFTKSPPHAPQPAADQRKRSRNRL